MIAISVYIVSYNYGRYLSQAIESVLKQTFKDFEILIFDDGSNDNTKNIINLYKEDKRVRVFYTENIGLIKVCNLALEKAKGKYIIRLDGDDYFDENILLVLYANIKLKKNISIVVPDYFLINSEGVIISYKRVNSFSEHHTVETPPNGACSLISVEILKEVGGYTKELLAQDGFDLWLKVKNISNILNVHLPLFYYRRHENNLTNKIQRLLTARQEIKKTTQITELKKAPINVLIPIRENYDFIKNLWNLKLNKKSLLEIAIDKCLKNPNFDNIIIACDNIEAKKTIDKYKNPKLSFELRSKEDTLRSISYSSAFRDIIQKYDTDYKGIVLFCFIQAPFVTTETLEESINTLIVHDADLTFAVEEIEVPIYKNTLNGLELVNEKVADGHQSLYKNANLVMATKTLNIKRNSLNNCNVANFLISPVENKYLDSNEKLKEIKCILKK